MTTSRKQVLIAGATGFVGRRLAAALAGKPHVALRCLSRRGGSPVPDGAALAGDLADRAVLDRALDGVDTVYYLVHSLDAGATRFAARDRTTAETFVAAAEAAGVRRVIYLSGLGRSDEALSTHLQSRGEVAELLAAGRFATTTLRAAIIIGAGGASFEILRFLVTTQLLLPEIDWLETRCQPIALENVVHDLVGCLDDERTAGRCFDIGGPEVLTYREMLERFADVAGTKNLFVPVPFYAPRLAASMIGALSTVDGEVALALLEGMANEVVCTGNALGELLPQRLIPYTEAVRAALRERQAGRRSDAASG